MPKYDYRCDANGRIVEVSHAMSASLSTWGELCQLADLSLDDTPADSPVHKIISGGYVVAGGLSEPTPPPACTPPSLTTMHCALSSSSG